MKKYLIGMALILFSPFIQAFDTAELAQMLQQPQNVQGAFAQQRYLKSLNQPMNTGGRFVLLPKKGLLWQMQKPFDNRLRVRADGIMQWNGKAWVSAGGGSRSGQAQQIKLFLDLLGGNTAGLEKQFDLQLSGNAKKWTLRLNPKTALMKQIFTRIDISGDAVVRKIELNETQGERTVMTFSGVTVNQPLDAFARSALQ
jgi:outer membrane lipoprotein-sorting protein